MCNEGTQSPSASQSALMLWCGMWAILIYLQRRHIKPQISKRHTSFVFAGCEAQTQKFRAKNVYTLIYNCWRNLSHLQQQLGVESNHSYIYAAQRVFTNFTTKFWSSNALHTSEWYVASSTLLLLSCTMNCIPMKWNEKFKLWLVL